MRITGQLLAVLAALSGLYMIFSIWADMPLGFLVAGGLTIAASIPALVIAYVLDRRPKLPVHGPVLKWGLSEDALHKKFHDPDMQRAWEEIVAAEKEDNR